MNMEGPQRSFFANGLARRLCYGHHFPDGQYAALVGGLNGHDRGPGPKKASCASCHQEMAAAVVYTSPDLLDLICPRCHERAPR